MDELKPCPFCGGEAEIFGEYFLNHHNNCVADLCREFTTKEGAIKSWNTRAPNFSSDSMKTTG